MYRKAALCTLLLSATAILFSGCVKHEYSSDAPDSPAHPPSVIIGGDNRLLCAFQPVNGSKNWEVSLPQSIYASPLVYNGSVYVGVVNYLSTSGIGCDTLYKINSETGVMQKKITIAGAPPFAVKATPIASGKIIYLATTNNNLYAIDTTTWAPAWTFAADGPLEASPTITDSSIIFASMAGSIYSVNKNTGTLIWSTNVGAGKSFTSSPAISSPYGYIGCSDSAVYSFYLNCPTTAGIIKWVFKTNGKITSSPTAQFGRCIIGSNDFNVYCLDTSNKGLIWKFPTMSNVNTSPVIHDQVVYVASNDYNLYAINILNGREAWRFSTNGLVKSSPTVYRGTIYLGSYDKYLYAIDSAGGTLKWTGNVNGHIQSSAAIEDYSKMQYNSQVSGYEN
ncbi:MAG: hypothetical protein EBX41_01200 [Chitinophagia bacterium]|nr:hypothetical protein [Chitinophagia bacterium]